jgi:hypothetical protein
MSTDNDEIDFLDSLEADPPATPAAKPQTAPVIANVTVSHRRTILELAVAALVGAGLVLVALVVAALWFGGFSPAPTPTVEIDPRFVSIGKAYVNDLGIAWGASLEDGSKILDAGQPIGMADDAVAKAWEANRKAAFNKRVTPELSKVVEQSKDEKTVTAADRSALAKAYRGLAKGASSR